MSHKEKEDNCLAELKGENEQDDLIAKKEAVNDNTDTSHMPIDRGWAWVILAACALEITVNGGMMRSFGVFFLQFQDRFHSSASETAIMNLVQNVCSSISALFIMTVGLQAFSCRTSVFIGGLLTVVGYLVTGFATQIWLFYVAFGILTGVANSFIHPPIFSILGSYFNRHRGLANSIFASGGSLGGLVFGPVVVRLFDEYGYSGAMLIISGLLMNIFVSASLLRPIEVYERRNEKRRLTALALKSKDITNGDNLKLQMEMVKPNSSLATSDSRDITDSLLINDTSPRSKILERTYSHDTSVLPENLQSSRRLRTMSECAPSSAKYESQIEHDRNHIGDSKSTLGKFIDAVSRSQVALYTSGEGLGNSFVDINVPQSEKRIRSTSYLEDEKQKEIPNVESESSGQTCCLSIKVKISALLCTIFDMNVLRRPVFLTFMLMAFCFISGISLAPVYIPTHAKDIGLSNTQIGTLIAMQSIIDLIAKVSLAVVADRGWLKRSTILTTSALVLGTAIHLVRFVTNFETVVVLQVISGLCCGQYMSIFPVFLMDVIGPAQFKKCLGFLTLVHGLSVATFFPVGGLLKDITGRYIATFHLLGSLAYFAGILASLIPQAQRRFEKVVDKT